MTTATPTTAELLCHLTEPRRSHSEAVRAEAAQAGLQHLPADHLAELVMAAALHDIGYASSWAHLGFHPIDGARHLRDLGFSALVCHLVATHTPAPAEAAARDLDPAVFDDFPASDDQAPRMQSLLTWADLTTGPTGQTVDVHDRLEEILTRYVPGDPVHTYVTHHHDWLLTAGSYPLGMLAAGDVRDQIS